MKTKVFVYTILLFVWTFMFILYCKILSNLYTDIDKYNLGLLDTDPDGSFIPNHVSYALVICISILGIAVSIMCLIGCYKQHKLNKKSQIEEI